MGRSLILFGAGASYGSDRQGTPPLGPRLFDALRASSPNKWGQIPATEAAAFKPDFEKGMKEYVELHSSDGTVDRLQRAMAAYFFGFQPASSSLYVKLASWMRQTGWNGAVASINYERLLALSLCQGGLNVIVGGPSCGSIELCLPHGCCNLFIPLKVQGPIVLGSPNLKMESPQPPVPIDNQSEFQQRICTDQLPPVMCYFEPGKDARCGLSFITGQRDRFRALVGSASVVVIVGVKVHPVDGHIWDPLAETDARLVYCAGEQGASEFKRWAGNWGRKRDRAIPAFWKESFAEICDALLS